MVESYFSLLDMMPDFDVDAAELERRYIEKQQQYHPDRYMMKPERERLIALQRTTDLNAAYDTLKDPLKRAEYLLSLKGIRVGTEVGGVKPGQTLLMKVMEERERLNEATDPQAIGLLQQEMQKDMEKCIEVLAAAFAVHNDEEASQLAIRLKYIRKFLEEARLKRRKLEH